MCFIDLQFFTMVKISQNKRHQNTCIPSLIHTFIPQKKSHIISHAHILSFIPNPKQTKHIRQAFLWRDMYTKQKHSKHTHIRSHSSILSFVSCCFFRSFASSLICTHINIVAIPCSLNGIRLIERIVWRERKKGKKKRMKKYGNCSQKKNKIKSKHNL